MTEPWPQQPRDIGAGWADDEVASSGEPAGGYPPAGLVSVRLLFDAVRRCVRLWLATGLVGLAIGAATPIVHPPGGVATTTLLLTHQPGDDPVAAMETDISLATTQTVAARVVEELGLPMTADSLLDEYTVTPLTDRVLEIRVTAPDDAAARIAATIGTNFLAFRMEQVRAQQRPTGRALDEAQARIERLRGRAETALNGDDVAQTAAGRDLQRAEDKAASLEQTLRQQQSDATVMSSSRVLDQAAPVPRSPLRTMLVAVVAGLVVGVILGIGIVVARALLSDRLWRRQAIAEALGVRVTLSARWIGGPRWWPASLPRLWPPRRREREMRRVARHLRDVALASRAATPVLAVVPVDGVRACARVLASLARSLAEDGDRVLVADLTGRRSLGRLLGVRRPGTTPVAADPTAPDQPIAETAATRVTVHLPEPGGPPEGPLRRTSGAPRSSLSRGELSLAWADADIVLTFTELDPSLGGDHLCTWSDRAVAVVTAGRSSATRIHATAQLVRAAGVTLEGAVLLGADRTDETVGLPADAVVWPASGPTIEMVGR